MGTRRILHTFLVTLILFCGTRLCAQDNTLRVMSFNIRYDNPNDAPNDWINRRDSLARFILNQDADIIGVQEALHNQMDDLALRLTDYTYVGVGRLDGKQAGEYAAIWYRKSRFELLEEQHYWLSPNPDVAGSIGWDAACERILTYAKLRDCKTKKDLLVLNTHFDHVGVEARRQSALFSLNRLNQCTEVMPIIFMGDLNMPPTDDSYKILTSASKNKQTLMDTRLFAKERKGEESTFHNWGRIAPKHRERIDYILVSPSITILTNEHISTQLERLYLSDHDAVLSYLSY